MLKEDIEAVSRIVILIEVGLGLEKDNFCIASGEMIKAAVGQDETLEQVLIETELDVSNVGNMAPVPKIAKICQRHSKIKLNNCTNARF